MKTLRIAEAIQKPIKGNIGKYIYLSPVDDNGDQYFTAQAPLCSFVFKNTLESKLESGHWNIKELLAVLKHSGSDLSKVTRIDHADTPKIDMPTEMPLFCDTDKLLSVINNLSVVFKDDTESQLMITKNSIYCFNKTIALQYWHGLDFVIDSFSLNAYQINILKKFKNCTGLSLVGNADSTALKFTFGKDQGSLFFNESAHNVKVSQDKLHSLLNSQGKYPDTLPDGFESELDLTLAKYIETIAVGNVLFNAKKLKLLCKYTQNIHVDTYKRIIYFKSEMTRGVLAGIRQ